jgi:NACalpha-BTF3-like transcription factor
MTRSAEQQKSQLDAVQSHVDNDESAAVDSAAASKALASLQQASAATQETVKLKKEDVDFVAAEFELSDAEAQQALVKHQGDVERTVKALLRQ